MVRLLPVLCISYTLPYAKNDGIRYPFECPKIGFIDFGERKHAEKGLESFL